jgi:hypothetical protein
VSDSAARLALIAVPGAISKWLVRDLIGTYASVLRLLVLGARYVWSGRLLSDSFSCSLILAKAGLFVTTYFRGFCLYVLGFFCLL